MVNDRDCPPGTRSYTIEAGDTVYQLAQQFDTSIPAIISANPFSNPDNLQVGEEICIPQQEQFPSCPEGNYYTVTAGDTFYSLAQTFNLSLADLKEANPQVDPEKLEVGQVICIPLATPPVECPEGAVRYIVRKGDTFYSIAQKFNISVSDLEAANPNLDPEALLIGQKICIPQQ